MKNLVLDLRAECISARICEEIFAHVYKTAPHQMYGAEAHEYTSGMLRIMERA